MAEALFSVTNSDDTLAVTVPGDVVDAACDDVVLAFGILCAMCVPDTDAASDVSTSDVVAGG